jgi:hypothetical protein
MLMGHGSIKMSSNKEITRSSTKVSECQIFSSNRQIQELLLPNIFKERMAKKMRNLETEL